MQAAPSLVAQLCNVFDAAPDVVADDALLFRRGDEVFERTGQRADASFNVGREQLREQIKQARGVGEPTQISPVRQINILLHPRAVELAEGKSIDRENVAVVLIQPPLKRDQCLRIG